MTYESSTSTVQSGGPFGCTVKDLKNLMAERKLDAVKYLEEHYGTVHELCRKLKTSPNEGNSDQSRSERQ